MYKATTERNIFHHFHARKVLPQAADTQLTELVVETRLVPGLGERQLSFKAREHGLVQVYAFTYVTGFFSKLGFRVVQHETLPRKVWMDCINCPKFNCCDEVAMVLDLVENAKPETFDVSQVNIPIVKITGAGR